MSRITFNARFLLVSLVILQFLFLGVIYFMRQHEKLNLQNNFTEESTKNREDNYPYITTTEENELNEEYEKEEQKNSWRFPSSNIPSIKSNPSKSNSDNYEPDFLDLKKQNPEPNSFKNSFKSTTSTPTSNSESHFFPKIKGDLSNKTLINTAKQLTDPDTNVLMVSSTNTGFKELAYNLYKTSIEKFDIKNYLMFATDQEAFEYLYERGVNVVYLESGSPSKQIPKRGEFGTASFKKIVNVKGDLTWKLLQAGIDVFLCDVDIIFFDNPIPDLLKEAEGQDAVVQSDSGDPDSPAMLMNSGFYLAKSTTGGLKIFERVSESSRRGLQNQNALIRALKMYKRTISYKILDTAKYPNGIGYFNQRRYLYPEKYPAPLIVHNNWVVGKEAKEYRFREMGMWYSEHISYYNDPLRKYITYSNDMNAIPRKITIDDLAYALKTALTVAKILDRVLILPKFPCLGREPVEWCTLDAHFSVKALNHMFKYRENSFFRDSRVPESQLSTDGHVYHIDSKLSKNEEDVGNKITLVPQQYSKGAQEEEILEWFGNDDHPLIEFDSFFGNDLIQGLKDPQESQQWESKLKQGVVKCDYIQHCSRKLKFKV
eukprot:gb/GECH01000009.1/.p1 GENE.gb/GECH01000009.1/~~gb/GECH01000009.1/.p1  ORF type:complete len:600 (+),score=145.33 gb/GECH01000009.1/:1-1800(+)